MKAKNLRAKKTRKIKVVKDEIERDEDEEDEDDDDEGGSTREDKRSRYAKAINEVKSIYYNKF